MSDMSGMIPPHFKSQRPVPQPGDHTDTDSILSSEKTGELRRTVRFEDDLGMIYSEGLP